MSDDRHEEITGEEREALRSLAGRPAPPAELEERTVRALHARGLLAAPGRRPLATKRIAAGLLAAAALYVLGMATGWRLAAPWSQAGSASSGGSEFMLLLHDPEGESRSLSEAEHEKRVGEYVAWARRLAESGSLVDGNELAGDGRLLSGPRGAPGVSEVIHAGGPTILGGYFLIRARDYADAVRIARDCPHLEYGGEIEIRRINPT